MTSREESLIFVEAIGRDSGRACFFHQIDVEANCPLPFVRIDLRFPLLIEPTSAICVYERAKIGHVFAPARFSSQAETVLLFGLIGKLGRKFLDLLIGRLIRHFEASCFKQILAI